MELFVFLLIIVAVFGTIYTIYYQYFIKTREINRLYDGIRTREERLEALQIERRIESEHIEIVTSEEQIDAPTSQPEETATIDNDPLSAMQPPK